MALSLHSTESYCDVMIAMALKALMPRSLYWRAAMIVLVPVMTILLVMAIVFFQRLYEGVTRQMTTGVAQEVQLVLGLVAEKNDILDAYEIATPLGIRIDFQVQPFEDQREMFDWSGKTVIEVFHEILPDLLAVDLLKDRKARLLFGSQYEGVVLEVNRSRLSARNPHQFLVLIGFTATIMSSIALIYLRNQVRPIRRLALAAEAFGKGRVVPYRVAGASEIRQAGTAFLEMRDRIERQIEQRTMMLSGVSHDLKTPLTRMKLGLSLMDPGEGTVAMERDVADMEEMLQAFLDFARGNGQEEPEYIDPRSILDDILNRAHNRQPVKLNTVEGQGKGMLRPLAIRRALENLVTNAVRYGKEAYVGARISADQVVFVVEDCGPGIPEDKRAEVLKPFVRLDTARNQDKGLGVGLGLTIAADIAQQHGGVLRVGESAKFGGAKLELAIPL